MLMQIGRERSGPEEHLRLLFYFGICHGFMVQQGTNFCGFEYPQKKSTLHCVAVHKAVWLHKLLVDLFGHEMDSTVIHYDNQSCVKLSENHVFHYKSKHIEIKYHYIGDMVQRKAIYV
jgi:hypothetical protein